MNSNASYSLETPNLGQNRRFFVRCESDLEIWRMTLKNNRAPLLSNIKLYASFHHHMWIQTGVTVRKRLSWVMNSVTLTFDLWPWPFAWTSLRSLVITPENFVMMLWWEHSKKGVTAVSDLKLYEIQASRACNFIKFQARLESSRPHKLLRQQSCWKGYLIFHIFNNVDNTAIATRFMNLIISRIWLFLITFLYYD